MKIMVAVKRVIDYAVKIRVKPDKVDLALSLSILELSKLFVSLQQSKASVIKWNFPKEIGFNCLLGCFFGAILSFRNKTAIPKETGLSRLFGCLFVWNRKLQKQ